MPSFVSRVERPDRGGEWVEYLEQRRAARRALGRAARARPRGRRAPTPPVACALAARRRRRGRSCSPRCCSRPRRVSEERARAAVARLLGDERARAARATSSASARNRRHRPGRGFEALRYRFEIVSDYGAFRDLQRHRMLTVQWQALTPDLGAGVPRRSPPPGAGDALRARARALGRGVRSGSRGAGLARRRALRALPRLPHPLRARPQRPRGDAADRAALRPRGPPELPRRRARDARADRRACTRPSRAAMTHVDHRRRAAAGAHPRRDAHRGEGAGPSPGGPDTP